MTYADPPATRAASDAPGSVLAEHAALHDAVQDRVAELIGVYNPQLSADRRTRTATMAFALFKAGLEPRIRARSGRPISPR